MTAATVEPPGQLELIPSAPAAPCSSYRVVSIDPASGCEAAPTGMPQWSESIRDLPVAAGRAMAAAKATERTAWLVGSDHTACEVDEFGNVTPSTGWALRAARFLNNRKAPSAMTTATATTTIELTLDQLVPHPDNVRRRLGDLTEMAKSIASKGVLEPMLVLPARDDGKHLVVAGHRRLAAAIKAKHQGTILCVVRDLTEVEVLETMLVENLQRADITAVEEARAYARLVELDSSIATIAKKVGRTQALVKSRLALMVLPAKVLDIVDRGDITLGEAEQLAEYADNDDAMAWVLDQYRTSAHPRDVVWSLKRHLTDLAGERAMSAAIEKLDQRGITRFDAQHWSRPFEVTLTRTCTLEILGLTAKAHLKEPCHAVHLVLRHGGTVDSAAVCTNPKRHTTKVKPADRSDLQMKPAKYAKAKGGGDPEVKARKKALAELKQRRTAFAATVATTAKPASLPALAESAVILAGKYDEMVAAAELLGIAGTDARVTGYAAFKDYLANAMTRERAVLALMLALGEAHENSNTEDNHLFLNYLEFLVQNGYGLSLHEENLLIAAERLDPPEVIDLPPAPPTPEEARIAELTQLSGDLPDGPELDEVNAELGRLLGATDEADLDSAPVSLTGDLPEDAA